MPESRALYDQSLDAAPPPHLVTEGPSVDPEMRKKIAAQNFRRARQLIEEKDYHPAVEMLREAVRFVPDQAEYRYVLSSVEMKNPNWIDQGLANLKEAARLDARRVAFSVEAARALLDHRRPHEAEPFAPAGRGARSLAGERAASPKVLDAAAQVPGASGDERPPAELAPTPIDAPSAVPPAGLLSRLFRHRG